MNFAEILKLKIGDRKLLEQTNLLIFREYIFVAIIIIIIIIIRVETIVVSDECIV